MIHSEKVSRLPIGCKRGGRHDIMLWDLCRVLAPDESAMLWIQPDVEDLTYDKKTYGAWFVKPKEPHVLVPDPVEYIYPVHYTQYRSLKRSILASIKRLHLPLQLNTIGKRPVITRLSDPS